MSISPRRLANGKTVYDVRLRTPDGRPYKRTFRTKDQAVKFHAREVTDRARGAWVDPNAGKITVSEYARTWLQLRADIRPRTRELYDSLLRIHIEPYLGTLAIGELTTAQIRRWNSGLVASGRVSRSTAAKVYRLLHAVLSTATEDEVIARNPCRVRRAGQETPEERPVASLAQISALADSIDPRYRAMVLLAIWSGMRFGELAGLSRSNLDLLRMRVTVVRQLQELDDGTITFSPPKTVAGTRTIALPQQLRQELQEHLETWAEPGVEGLVFTAPGGGPIRRSNFNRRQWQPACKAAGMDGFRFHDLRHTGNTLAASTGASIKELMARMGHASARAALIYQHATAERDEAIAHALGEIAIKHSTRQTATAAMAESDEYTDVGTTHTTNTHP